MAAAAEIYQQAIKDLAAAATGHGTLAHPGGRFLADNPLCGDRVEMQVAASAGRITALAHQVKGCLLCRAAAAAIGKRAIGADRAAIEQVSAAVAALLRNGGPPPEGWDELSVFTPVHGHASRYRCVELPFEALAGALAAADR